jgi:hypothetical protein
MGDHVSVAGGARRRRVRGCNCVPPDLICLLREDTWVCGRGELAIDALMNEIVVARHLSS